MRRSLVSLTFNQAKWTILLKSQFAFFADELEHTFTLEEFKEKLEDGKNKSWKSFFVEGVEDMEVLDIEQSLPSKAAKEDIRHDLTFYTPTCRDVRVKVLVAPEWWDCN